MQCKRQWEDQQVDPPVCDECGTADKPDKNGFCVKCADVVEREMNQAWLEETLKRAEAMDIPEYVRDLARQCRQESVRGVQR